MKQYISVKRGCAQHLGICCVLNSLGNQETPWTLNVLIRKVNSFGGQVLPFSQCTQDWAYLTKFGGGGGQLPVHFPVAMNGSLARAAGPLSLTSKCKEVLIWPLDMRSPTRNIKSLRIWEGTESSPPSLLQTAQLFSHLPWNKSHWI